MLTFTISRPVRIIILCIALAIYVAIFSTGCGAKAYEADLPEPEQTRLIVRPPMGLAPVYVILKVIIDYPTPEWYCPSVRVYWPDGTESFQEGDCPPWGEPGTEGRWSWTRREKRPFMSPGQNTIKVELQQGAKRKILTAHVEVVG